MAQLTTQKLGVIKVPVPSFEEQEEIGNFLREKNNIKKWENRIITIDKQRH